MGIELWKIRMCYDLLTQMWDETKTGDFIQEISDFTSKVITFLEGNSWEKWERLVIWPAKLRIFSMVFLLVEQKLWLPAGESTSISSTDWFTAGDRQPGKRSWICHQAAREREGGAWWCMVDWCGNSRGNLRNISWTSSTTDQLLVFPGFPAGRWEICHMSKLGGLMDAPRSTCILENLAIDMSRYRFQPLSWFCAWYS